MSLRSDDLLGASCCAHCVEVCGSYEGTAAHGTGIGRPPMAVRMTREGRTIRSFDAPYDYITNSLLRTATPLTTSRVYTKSHPSSLIEGRLRRRPEGWAGWWRPGAAERTAVAGGAGPDRPDACVRSGAKSRRGSRWALPGDEAPVPRPKIATWSAERRRPARNGTRRSRLASAMEMQ
jgi:hypothetical protein